MWSAVVLSRTGDHVASEVALADVTTRSRLQRAQQGSVSAALQPDREAEEASAAGVVSVVEAVMVVVEGATAATASEAPAVVATAADAAASATNPTDSLPKARHPALVAAEVDTTDPVGMEEDDHLTTIARAIPTHVTVAVLLAVTTTPLEVTAAVVATESRSVTATAIVTTIASVPTREAAATTSRGSRGDIELFSTTTSSAHGPWFVATVYPLLLFDIFVLFPFFRQG